MLYIFPRPAVVRLRLALARLWPVVVSSASLALRALLPIAHFLAAVSPFVALVLLWIMLAPLKATAISVSVENVGNVVFCVFAAALLVPCTYYATDLTVAARLTRLSLGCEPRLLSSRAEVTATREAISLSADAAASPSGLLPTSRLATAGGAFVGAGAVASALRARASSAAARSPGGPPASVALVAAVAMCASAEATEEGGTLRIAWRLPGQKQVDAHSPAYSAGARDVAATALRMLRAARAEGLSLGGLTLSAVVSACALAAAAAFACLCPAFTSMLVTPAPMPPWIRATSACAAAFLRFYAAATVALPAARWVAERTARAAEAAEARTWAAEVGKERKAGRERLVARPPRRIGAVDWSPSAQEALAVAYFGAKLDGCARLAAHPPEGGAAAAA